jgi:eukaryotic-like serine/threonine-protein kinase
MTFKTGTKLGSYEIVEPLGAGGMGEVYRAKDSKLKREVAIKVLPDAFSHDAERVSRFQREAEVLASLNHPHIGAIYDIVTFGASRFLVLELVEGATLAERIARGPIPLNEALSIAKQITEALEAAHDKGVIHRDLKPANIKLTVDGHVKVLDFGLAKVREAESTLSNSPTVMTLASGMILGTAAYMSPEQAKGKDADRSSDVWAFGCVLYEMLTGRAVFVGETINEIMAEVFKAEPDWSRLPAETPESIRRLLRRSLQKEEKLRLRDLRDARMEIDEVQIGRQTDRVVVHKVPRRRERVAWVLAVVLLALITVVLITVVGIVWAFRPALVPPEARLDVTTPPTTDSTSLAISPDGQKIAFVATSDGRPRLWLRSLDSVSARPIAGTDYASLPFWAPDNRSIGFFADGKLKRMDINGGSVQTLANAPYGRGAAWNPEGVMLFAPTPGTPIFKISATGGEPAPVTSVHTPQQVGHQFPQFLPDGRHFLYSVTGGPEGRGIYIGQLGASETKLLVDADAAAYAASGQLLFVRQGTLFTQDFDPVRLELSGNPVTVTENLRVQVLSASRAGPIVYRADALGDGPPGSAVLRRQREFIWFDRSGSEIRKVGREFSGGSEPSLSPDGSRVAVFADLNGNVDIWLLEIARGVFNRFTVDAADEIFPVWSPDGARIAFSSNRRTGQQNLYLKPTSGGEAEELMLETAQPKFATDWSPNGRFLLYFSAERKTGLDIWALAIDGDRKPFPVVQTNFDERLAQFSPDGNWIAYESNESGRVEIYVQPFAGPESKAGSKLLVSTNGGAQVRWRRDGKELFYIALDGRLMSVPIRFASSSQALEPGVPVPLFATRLNALQVFPRHEYVVSQDGQRFLINVEETSTAPITVILNWKANHATH